MPLQHLKIFRYRFDSGFLDGKCLTIGMVSIRINLEATDIATSDALPIELDLADDFQGRVFICPPNHRRTSDADPSRRANDLSWRVSPPPKSETILPSAGSVNSLSRVRLGPKEGNFMFKTAWPPQRVTVKKWTSKNRSQITKLIWLTDQMELFHHGEDCFAVIVVDGHKETWPLRSRGFRNWLSHHYYVNEKQVLRSSSLSDVICALEGRARFDSPEYPIYVRLAGSFNSIYLDMANKKWSAIKITKEGWSIVQPRWVHFRRTNGMLPLPKPVAGGSIDELRQFVNVSDKDWPLLVGWLIGALMPHGPYPLLVLQGEQDTAKSTLLKILRSLVDPNRGSAKTEPKDPRDLMIAATNSWVQSFDNLSYIRVWFSDTLCRISTGGALSTRMLYENDEEKIFEVQRPIILTGIEELATRSDLLDRSIVLYLPNIPKNRQQAETDLMKSFEQARPKIMGALFSAVCCALKNLPNVQLSGLPRMANFAKWVSAAEPALTWKPGTIMAAYDRNRQTANQLPLEASPITEPLLRLMQANSHWEGTASELFKLLNPGWSPSTQRRNWPSDPTRLSGALRRLAPNLRPVVDIQFGRGRKRMIAMTLVGKIASIASIAAHPVVKFDADDAGVAKILTNSNGKE